MQTELDYPYSSEPPFGAPTAVADGVFWVRMPLELTGLNHINLWLLRDGEGWCLVDTGMRSDETLAHWSRIFAEHLGGRPVTRVLCTHFHPDHMGLAGWLTEHWRCPLWATRQEWLSGRLAWLEPQDETPEHVVAFSRKIGASGEALQLLRRHGFNNYQKYVTEVPPQYRRISDGQSIWIGGREWRVIVGHGHAPEHAALHCAELDLLISGDQVLPRITAHIGVSASEPDANPLLEYLDSLQRFRPLPPTVLVLPSHGLPFRGLHRRLESMERHHLDRLRVLEEMLDEPKRLASTLKVLYNRMLRPHEAFLGVTEALAHLNYLIERERVVREEGADGVWRFRRTRPKIDAA